MAEELGCYQDWALPSFYELDNPKRKGMRAEEDYLLSFTEPPILPEPEDEWELKNAVSWYSVQEVTFKRTNKDNG